MLYTNEEVLYTLRDVLCTSRKELKSRGEGCLPGGRFRAGRRVLRGERGTLTEVCISRDAYVHTVQPVLDDSRHDRSICSVRAHLRL